MRYSFPPEFDSGFYVQCKPYLAGAPKDLLEQEFRKIRRSFGMNLRLFFYKPANSGFAMENEDE